MPTITLNAEASQASASPGLFRLELAELVSLAREAGVRLPFATDRLDSLEPTGISADERRAWQQRLSEDPTPEDALAFLLSEQHDRAAEAAADPDRHAARAAMVQALRVWGAADVVLHLELGLRKPRGRQARAWVGVRGDAVVSIGTVSGALFEVTWAPLADLPDLLSHLVRLPDAPPPPGSPALPARFGVPVELLAATGLGAPSDTGTLGGRLADVLPALVESFPEAVSADGAPCSTPDAVALLSDLTARLTARLRVLVFAGQASDAERARAGVVSWMRLDSQWYALDVAMADGVPLARGHAVEPRDLMTSIGPVLAGVWGAHDA